MKPQGSERIAVIGTGYVGLVTGACLAEIGHNVICVDNDKSKIDMLRQGQMPIYEPGLSALVLKNVKRGRLVFSDDIAYGIKMSKVIFIAVGTPPRAKGEADLSAVENVAEIIARNMNSYKLIVQKSTVPITTGDWVQSTISMFKKRRAKFDIASNPEFLREGTAINDFMRPDRIVIGAETERAKNTMAAIYRSIKTKIIFTDIKSAELIKHASNSFLAMKISFVNSLSRICDLSKADIDKVAEGIGMDRRIGRDFLKASLGYGGFCFPKDLSAFIHASERLGYNPELLKAVGRGNEQQKEFFFRKIKRAVWNIEGKKNAVLGLSFKPNTDDIRLSPAIDVINMLKKEHARISVFDPEAMGKAGQELRGVSFCKDSYEAAKGADCLVIATEWPVFGKLDWAKVRRILKRPIVVDGRNMFDPAEMRKLGFVYVSIGRN
ncbi:MAG: UDP-glucose/GDP-mannose dehydrogenase family protein [Candidatus Omnitrophica bacterium]|nr:UDP-glucose/GDP-mannose dehydrogenase family protein [Candidatus Omnitrophota bacterium]